MRLGLTVTHLTGGEKEKKRERSRPTPNIYTRSGDPNSSNHVVNGVGSSLAEREGFGG